MLTAESVCRACLIGDVSAYSHSIQNMPLQQLYEKLTSVKLSEGDGMPKTICSICYSRLQRFNKFSNMALQSERILKDLFNRGIEEVTRNTIIHLNLGLIQNLTTTPAQSMSIVDDCTNSECTPLSQPAPTRAGHDSTQVTVKIEGAVKKETVSEDEVMVKTEKNTKNEDVEMDNGFNNKKSVNKGEASNANDTLSGVCCDVCSKHFGSVGILKSHMTSHSGEKTYTCQTCNNSFSRKHNMVQHMTTCTNLELPQDKSDSSNPDDLGSYCCCDVCSKTFGTIHLLKSHMISHSGEKPFTCKKCRKAFSRKHNMVQHMKTCNYIKQSQTNPDDMSLYFHCDVCNKKFGTKYRLNSHLITHSSEKPHVCEGCGKTFSRKQNMKQHMKICAEVESCAQTFPCTFCTQTFNCESDLADHVTTHSAQKPYTCEKCNKSFSTKPNMKQHMKICFLKNESVNCTLCTETFSTRSDLCKHLNLDHTEEKPFICDRCSTKFWHKSHLKAHMRIHTGEKPFACEICGKTFTLRNHLKAHMGTHTGDKPYACQTCGKAFLANGNLREHMRSHTGEKPYACATCGKTFGHQSTLRQHVRRVHLEAKPFACDSCSMSFTLETSLAAHLRIHTAERPYACDICDKTFFEARYLKGHMQVHSDERPHACNACGKAYKRPEHLKLHIKSKCKATFGIPGFDLQI